MTDLHVGDRVTYRGDAQAGPGTVVEIVDRLVTPYVVTWDAWPDLPGCYDAADLVRIDRHRETLTAA